MQMLHYFADFFKTPHITDFLRHHHEVDADLTRRFFFFVIFTGYLKTKPSKHSIDITPDASIIVTT